MQHLSRLAGPQGHARGSQGSNARPAGSSTCSTTLCKHLHRANTPSSLPATTTAAPQVIPRFRTTILPRKTRQCKQKTLVLDLDETLVHSSLEAVANSDFTFPVHFNNQEHMIHVRQRPHLIQFMERVSELFEVVVFTASQKIYAEKLLNIIDPQRKYVKHRIYRESCVVVDGNYLKDLTVLGRDLRTTFIIDNSPQAFGFQVRLQGWAAGVGSGQGKVG